MISELSPPQSLQSTHDKPGCKKTLLSRIRQTFCSGSMREPTSASPRSQHEQPLPLCPWPAQQSQPSTATLAPREATLGWQKGHRDNPSTPIPIRHVFPTLGKALLGMFPYCPIPTLAAGTGRGIPMPVALLQGVSALSSLKIQFFHPVPPPQQVSYPAYQPLPKGILKFLSSQGFVRPQGGPSKSHNFMAGM